MASELGGRGPNSTCFAVYSYAFAPSNPPVLSAGSASVGFASDALTCCPACVAPVGAPDAAPVVAALELAVFDAAGALAFVFSFAPHAATHNTANNATARPHRDIALTRQAFFIQSLRPLLQPRPPPRPPAPASPYASPPNTIAQSPTHTAPSS